MLKRIIDVLRKNRKLRTAVIVLILGTAYFILVETTSFGIPCVFNKVTGLACPGCGITRMIIDASHLDFAGAARRNLAIAVLAPMWIIIYAVRFIFKPACLGNDGKVYNILLWASAVGLVLFGIVRNIPGMEFLLP